MYLSDSKLQGKCSCIECKKMFTIGGIDQHFHLMHTEMGIKERAKFHYRANQQKADRIAQYNQNPALCQQCDAAMEYRKRKNKFCSSSCAASYNNLLHSPESRKQQSEKASKTLKEHFSKNPRPKKIREKKDPILKVKTKEKSKQLIKRKKPSFCKISFCVICCKYIPNKHRKTCSVLCCRKLSSQSMSNRLKDPDFRKNYGRQKRSYLEESFSKWLEANDVPYEYEIQFKNHELNKYYYADFVFRDLKLIIELDGTQHRKTVEQDCIRDEYLSRVYGYHVIRITHKEYQAKSKYLTICDLLGITC